MVSARRSGLSKRCEIDDMIARDVSVRSDRVGKLVRVDALNSSSGRQNNPHVRRRVEQKIRCHLVTFPLNVRKDCWRQGHLINQSVLP